MFMDIYISLLWCNWGHITVWTQPTRLYYITWYIFFHEIHSCKRVLFQKLVWNAYKLSLSSVFKIPRVLVLRQAHKPSCCYSYHKVVTRVSIILPSLGVLFLKLKDFIRKYCVENLRETSMNSMDSMDLIWWKFHMKVFTRTLSYGMSSLSTFQVLMELSSKFRLKWNCSPWLNVFTITVYKT